MRQKREVKSSYGTKMWAVTEKYVEQQDRSYNAYKLEEDLSASDSHEYA